MNLILDVGRFIFMFKARYPGRRTVFIDYYNGTKMNGRGSGVYSIMDT